MDNFEAFSPIYFVSKLSGFALFTIDRKDLTARIRKFDLILQIMWTIVTTSLNFIYWNTYFEITVHKSDIIKITVPILLYGNLIIYTFYMFWSVLMRKSIAKILKKFQEIDCALNCVQINFNYGQQRDFNWKVLMSVMAISNLIVFYCVVCQWKHNMIGDAKIGIFLFWGMHCGSLLIVQYILTLLAIRQRFRSINRYITSSCPKKLSQEMNQFAKVHRKLTETIRLVNQIFSPIITLFIAISFGWICIFLFSMLEFASDFWEKYLMMIIAKILLHGFVTILSFAIIWMSVTTTEEGSYLTMQHLFDISNHSNEISRHDVRNKSNKMKVFDIITFNICVGCRS
jgi:hypothetical protein